MYRVTRISQAFDGHFHRGGWAHPVLALLFLALVGVAIGAVVWLLVRAARPHPLHYMPSVPAPPDPAIEVLRSRFARGEIDADEFDARAARLSGLVPPPARPPSMPPSS
jgi:putative membrane protein